MKTYERYADLKKPSWAPPARVFGPVWTILYLIITISFAQVFYTAWLGQFSYLVALPFTLNLIFNFSYTPLQFKLKSNLLASLDILAVLGTLVWALLIIYPYMNWVTYINIPYLLWVSFATVLNYSIWSLN